MSANGSAYASLTTRQLMDLVKRSSREAEIEAEVERRLAERLAEHRAEQQRLADARGEGLRRSQMSAKAISDFIRNHPGGPQAGAAAFRTLPK